MYFHGFFVPYHAKWHKFKSHFFGLQWSVRLWQKKFLLEFLQSKTLHVIKLQTSQRVIPNTIRIFEWNLTKWFYGLISILFMTVTHRNRSGLRWESLSFSRWGQMQRVLWYVTIFFSWGPSEPSSILIYLIEHIIWINFFHGKLSRLKT